jgi:hypothetical protein
VDKAKVIVFENKRGAYNFTPARPMKSIHRLRATLGA